MAIAALGGQPFILGGLWQEGTLYTGASANGSSVLLDATNEACIIYGYILTEDGGSHTIDTTGSSSLGWFSGALTFANGGTTVKVGLAAMDLTAGPAGRAANVANVITFDVSKTLTGGGGGITANAWQEHVPDAGSKTIANGALVAFAVQMTAAAGADAVNVNNQSAPTATVGVLPSITGYTGGTYAGVARLPNAIITFSDGTYGVFLGSFVYSVGTTTQTWNSGSATKEYGNYIQAPGPLSIYGIAVSCLIGGDTDFILYTSPLGTPVAAKTVSVDANAIGVAAFNKWTIFMFSSPYTSTAGQPLAVVVKPGASNVSMPYLTVNAAGHQKAHQLGTNCYALNRASGAFAAQNSNKDRFAIGLLVGGIDDAVSVAGGGAVFGAVGGVVH